MSAGVRRIKQYNRCLKSCKKYRELLKKNLPLDSANALGQMAKHVKTTYSSNKGAPKSQFFDFLDALVVVKTVSLLLLLVRSLVA